MMVGEAVTVAVAAMADGEGVTVIFWRVRRSDWHEQNSCCFIEKGNWSRNLIDSAVSAFSIEVVDFLGLFLGA